VTQIETNTSCYLLFAKGIYVLVSLVNMV